MEDQELLDTLRRAPERGMELLLRQYGGLVYAVVKGRLPQNVFCAADIEDCAADTFSEFYLGLERYDLEKGSVRAWLCVIARRGAIDLVRRRYREAKVLPLEGTEEFPAQEVPLESGLEERELRRAVLEAVRELEEPDREVLLRKFYLGESSKDIAARLGMTVANVDTRTHRAIERLRNKLKKWG